MMKTSALLLCELAVIVSLCSCAHKSGHAVSPSPYYPVAPANQTVPPVQPNQTRPSADTGQNVTVPSQSGSRTKLEGKDIFSKYNTAVFMVYTSDGRFGWQGSGFFINNNGLAVSNYHVFKGSRLGQDVIKFEGSDTYYDVTEIIAQSENDDFILFRVNLSNTNYIPIAKSKPSVGERVFAIGSPLGLENTFSSGEISQWRGNNRLQISVPIDHGSSGGALINEYGEVVGITSAGYESQANLNIAISIDVIRPYINQTTH